MLEYLFAEVTCQGPAGRWLLFSGKEAAARPGPTGQGPPGPKQDRQQLGASSGAQTQPLTYQGTEQSLPNSVKG